MASIAGSEIYIPFDIDQTDTLAGTSKELVAPADGFLTEMLVAVAATVGTGGTVTAAIGTTAVAGLVVTVADSAAKGTRYTAAATKGSATRRVSKGDRIQITPAAAFASSGSLTGFLVLSSSVTGEENAR